MADIPIWEGDSTFVPGMTPYGYYDNDPIFQQDAVKFARHAAFRLGYPIMDVELVAEHFYSALESAINEYSNEVFRFKIQDNYINYEGSPTGSAFNNILTVPSLGNLIRISKTYGSEAGSGGIVPHYSGSIDVTVGRQGYNLNQWATESGSIAPGDTIEIKRIFHTTPPASVRWADPFTGTGNVMASAMDSLGWSNMGQTMNYMMMPVSYDVTRMQAIEFNDEIRRSSYSFELKNNWLRIFPVPSHETKIWFEYIKVSERDNVINPNMPTGVVTNPSNVPFETISYTSINSPGKQWIIEYGFAVVKEILAMVRGKYNVVEVPGSTVTLNHAELAAQAQREKENLLLSLKDFLQKTSKSAQIEKQQLESDQLKGTLSNIPMKIYVG